MGDGFFEVLARREFIVLIEFHSSPMGVSWFDSFELLFCQQQGSDTIRVIRKATEEERRQHRVPLWIQVDKVPE